MEEASLTRLNLCAPLFYTGVPGLEPFAYQASGDDAPDKGPRVEELFCFEIDPAAGRSFEPDRNSFPGTLVFAGRDAGSGISPHAETVQIPAGLYLFTQKRAALGRDECIDMAIEQQKDGLWERLRPDNRLYVRYLFEDGRPVSQLFRPYSGR
jgi:hypothetical protein